MKNSKMENTSDSRNTWKSYLDLQDFALKAALDEYWHWSSDMHNMQLSIVKNYLWLAAISASAIGAALGTLTTPFSNMNPAHAIAVIFLCSAEICAVYAFISGVKLMLGERGGWRPIAIPSYCELLENARGDDDSFKTAQLKIDLLDSLNKNIDSLRKIHSEKGEGQGL